MTSRPHITAHSTHPVSADPNPFTGNTVQPGDTWAYRLVCDPGNLFGAYPGFVDVAELTTTDFTSLFV